MGKGISILSGVLFLAIVVTAIFLIYQTGVPIVKRMQVAAAVERMKDVFTDMDEAIQLTASEGRGSTRTVHMRIDPGRIVANKTQDAIYWELETDAEIISPRTSQRLGNIVIGSNMETRGYEGNYTYSSPETECYILENGHLRVYVKKIGSPSSHAGYDTSDLLVAIYNKDMDQWLNHTGLLDISVDLNESSKTGTGHTALLTAGYNLPYASASACMNSSYMDYYVNFTLESGADFLEIEASM